MYPAGGEGKQGGGWVGGGGGAKASAGPHVRQQRVGGLATPLVESAQGGGMCSTHVHGSTGWKEWASTPKHVNTWWRIRLVLHLCCQPTPRYQLRGYGSAAIAAPGPQRTYRCCCPRRTVALQPILTPLPPRGHVGAPPALKLQRTHGSICSICSICPNFGSASAP